MANLTKKANCLSVQSSVTERPLTAGVWIRTGVRFLVPGHIVLSNLHVSVFTPELYVCGPNYMRSNCIVSHLLLPIIPETLFNPSNPVPGLPSVAPPTVRPLPRPDVTPPTNTEVTLLYAQGQKIGALPLNGTRLDAARSKTLLTLHVRDDWIDCTDDPVLFCFVLLHKNMFKWSKRIKNVAQYHFHFFGSVGRAHINISKFTLMCVCPGFHSCWYSLWLQREPSLLDRFVCKNNQQSFSGTWSWAWDTN